MQDEITLVPRQWKLLLGARLEDNSLSGFEPQPNVRLPGRRPKSTACGPSGRGPRAAPLDRRGIQQRVLRIDAKTGLPLRSRVSAADPLDAERLSAFELGYRRQLSGGSVEVVAYHHRYDGLFAEQYGPVVAAPPGSPWPVEQMLYRNNVLNADSVGLELSAEAQVSADSRVSAAYTVKDVSARMPAGLRSRSVNVRVTEMEPHHTPATVRPQSQRPAQSWCDGTQGRRDLGRHRWLHGDRPALRLASEPVFQVLRGDPEPLRSRAPGFISDDFFPRSLEVPRRLLLKAVWTH